MHPDVVSNLWREYRGKEIDRSLHPDDHMFNSAKNGWTDYLGVGESAMAVICTSLQAGPSYHVRKIIDFGCGHGRVARHLRAFFPNAEMTFVDIDPTCVEFCAKQFGGTPIVSSEDFSTLKLPSEVDLIWLGSVFTHLDWDRMTTLFDVLVNSLALRGTIVATFRGEHMYRLMHAETDPNQRAKWASMLRQYEAGGFGYGAYNKAENPEWGLSLTSIARLAGMGKRYPEIRLVNYTEVGWAAVHDVASWARSPVPLPA